MAEQHPVKNPEQSDEIKQRDRRNVAIALALAAFIILVFAVTIIRLGGSVAERSF